MPLFYCSFCQVSFKQTQRFVELRDLSDCVFSSSLQNKTYPSKGTGVITAEQNAPLYTVCEEWVGLGPALRVIMCSPE